MSPIAEACFKELVKQKGVAEKWLIDSAATSRYEIGSPPDSRGRATMEKHGIYDNVEAHRARQITKTDYDKFDYIFGMDESNMRNLKSMAPKGNYKAELLLLGSFDSDKSFKSIIEDPYYGGDEGFEVVFNQCV